MSVLAQVERLIALSASPNENEARTAAALACKRIREHGLRVVSAVDTPITVHPKPAAPPPPPPAPKPRKRPPPPPAVKVNARAYAPGSVKINFGGVEYDLHEVKYEERPRKGPTSDDRVYPMRMLSVHGDSQCERCCERIVIGTPIRYARGCTGWIHEACGTFTTEGA